MIGRHTIEELRQYATDKAKNLKLEPYIAKTDGDIEVRNCPNLGDYLPKGWTITNTYFVDSSGFGADDEPALTFGQFLNKVRAGYGYAIYEAGEFQVYIREYKKEK